MLFFFSGCANMWRLVLLLCLATPSLGQQSKPNRVVSVATKCDKGSIIVDLEMDRPFKGLVFSKDFSTECQSQGTCIHFEYQTKQTGLELHNLTKNPFRNKHLNVHNQVGTKTLKKTLLYRQVKLKIILNQINKNIIFSWFLHTL